MKLIHLSDLHLGKRLNEFDLLGDQRYILEQILHIIDEEAPDAVLIAGDVYDRSVPPADAVVLFDWFLGALAKRQLSVLIISGNHDSAERLSFGSRLLQNSRIYISPVYDGSIEPVVLSDEHGDVKFWLLPFLRPSDVRRSLPDANCSGYHEAVQAAVEALHIDKNERNVILVHQFITGARVYRSEEIYVGTVENISAEIFEDFDYTALGHLHGPQNVGGNKRIRYCGTPLKYSFSEIDHQKSVTVVELGAKGTEPDIREVTLTPQRELCELEGSFQELISGDQGNDNYMRIVLDDPSYVPDAVNRLRKVFPNIMELDYKFRRDTVTSETLRGGAGNEVQEDPGALFREFYRQVNPNAQEMTEEQTALIDSLIREIWEEQA